ncbi:hypothetical protein ACLBX9_03200, partial [Methylobacterium sp. A49B]
DRQVGGVRGAHRRERGCRPEQRALQELHRHIQSFETQMQCLTAFLQPNALQIVAYYFYLSAQISSSTSDLPPGTMILSRQI